jgi:hypothetical protein
MLRLEAGHLLGVHRATIYRWLDGFMSVPIVVELLLRLNMMYIHDARTKSESSSETVRTA